MQQLLLILICLFVSFEVRSESDDLSGKKLLCENDFLLPSNNRHPLGLEFNDESKLTFYSFSGLGKGEVSIYGKNYIYYPVNLNSIFIKYDTESAIFKQSKEWEKKTGEKSASINFQYILNRTSLKLQYTNFARDEVWWRDCIIFNGNLEIFFKNYHDDFINDVKSKRKI